MVEERLPAHIKSSAKINLGEYAWKVPDVYATIEAAAALKLAVVVGDPRIELPQGVFEFESDAGVGEEMRGRGESWPAFVERSAAEAKRAIQRLTNDRRWLKGQDFAPKKIEDLEWVLYFMDERAG